MMALSSLSGDPMLTRSFLPFLCLVSTQAFALDCGRVLDSKLPKELTEKFTEISESFDGSMRIRIDNKKAFINGNLAIRNEYQPKEGVSPYYQNGWLHDFFRFQYKNTVARRIYSDDRLSIFGHLKSETRGGDITNWVKPDNYYEITFVVLDKTQMTVSLEQVATFRPEYLEYKKKGYDFLRSKPVDFRNKKNILTLSCDET